MTAWRYLASRELRVTAICTYFAVLLALGIILVYRAPPMSGIDEMFHFKRALQVSAGGLFPHRYGRNDWGGKLDRRMDDYEGWFDDRRNTGIVVTIAGADAARRRIEAGPRGRRADHFPSTASYPPLAYVPAAIGLAVARWCHADLDVQVHAGRLGSLLGYLLVLAVVVVAMPVARVPTLAVLSTPTALHLGASFSADPMTNTVTALFAAWCLRLHLEAGRGFTAGRRVLFLGLAAALGLLKLTCAMAGLLALLVPAPAFATRAQAWRFRLLAIAICAGLSLAWNLTYPFVPGRYWRSGGDPAVVLHMIAAAPGHQLLVVLHNVRQFAYFWWVDGYSRFCTGPWPFFFMFDGASAVLGLLVVVLLAVADHRGPSRPAAAGLFLLVGAVYELALLFAFKVGFSPPASIPILGLQGRYFLIPTLFAVLAVTLALPRRVQGGAAVVPLLALYLALTVHLVTLLLGRYAPTWS